MNPQRYKIIPYLFGLVALFWPLKSFECSDFYLENWRFWLFQPDITGVSSLLPFTYNSEIFHTANTFYDSPSEGEIINPHVNAQEWKAQLGKKVTEADTYQALYLLQPIDFFSNRDPKDNTFFSALRLPKNSSLLSYFQYAKLCEKTLAEPIDSSQIKEVRHKGNLLFRQTKLPFVRQRLAYQILKLSGYLGDRATMKEQLVFLRKNTTSSAWVRSMAFSNYAVTIPPGSPDRNYWLAMAFENCRWNKEYFIQLLDRKSLPSALKFAKNNKERAILEGVAAIHYPGRALDRLKRIYALAPDYSALNLLLAREVNKLESWLLSQKVNGMTRAHFELETEDRKNVDYAKLLRSDLQYLHQVDEFIRKALNEGKIEDVAFWQLSSAHLMLIDGDFAKTRQQLELIAKPNQLPIRLQVQVRITRLLAQILEKSYITAETENQIPLVFDFITQHNKEINEAETLKSQLALFLSDVFIRKRQVAKGVLLLSKTDRSWTGKFGNRTFYLKLLEIARPKDYDETLALLGNDKNRSRFAVWLRNDPVPANFYPPKFGDWDPAIGQFVPWQIADQSWDLNKIREFKAHYYIWHDHLDSAYTILKTIPETYWIHQEPANVDFFKNPFSVGIAIPSIPLSEETYDFNRNQAKFIRKMMELRWEAEQQSDPAKKQAAYLLLGNAYFNLTWQGRWWSVFQTFRSSGEFDDIRIKGNFKAYKISINYLFPGGYYLGMVLLGFIGAMNFNKNRSILFLLTVSIFVLMLWNCQRKADNINNNKNTKPVNPESINYDLSNGSYKFAIPVKFKSAYYACSRALIYYEKAVSANPRSEAAIAAAYMAELCKKSHALYLYQQSHPHEYLDEDDIKRVIFLRNSYLNKLPKDLRFESAVSCALFNDFLKKHGR